MVSHTKGRSEVFAMGETRGRGSHTWQHSGGPSVSVIIPTRDRIELLRKAVDGVLQQRYRGVIEVIVVFDQTDPMDIGVQVPGGRVLGVLRNTRTPGLAGARNTGTLAAHGDLIAFCDDDDEWLPDKLSQQVELLNSYPETRVVAGGVIINYRGKSVQRIPRKERVTFRDLLRSRMMEIHPSTFLVRRNSFLNEIGLVDESLPGSYAEDYEWLLRAARGADILVVRQPVARIYWHSGSYYSGRWDTVVEALEYLLQKYPEFEEEPRGLARILGQIAFAHAACGRRKEALVWARKARSLYWLELRAYLASAVARGRIDADKVVRLARRLGRGI